MRIPVRILAALLMIATLPAAASADTVPNPVVEGPVTGGIHGRPWHSSVVPLAPAGFVEEEFFISGASMGVPYKTRLIVRRPADGTFSGTVFMDWINVTGATDLETLWPTAIPAYFDERHAYVGLTAQIVGVNGLKAWDPVRYASLVHPGDIPHSNNILAQAVQAIRSPQGINPLGDAGTADYIIVGGSSQSAIRLNSYITEGNPIVGHIDAFWISRTSAPGLAAIAEDLKVPMIASIEEGLAVQAPDNDYYRTWEGAGQAHAPKVWSDYVWQVYSRDLWQHNAQIENGINAGCGMNRGTVQYSSRNGVHWLNKWVRGEGMPPVAPRIARDANGSQIRDAKGNVVGGLRYPFIEVPLATNASTGCPLFGSHVSWSKDTILSLYPTHADYYDLVAAHVAALQADGFLRPYDVVELLDAAASLDIWSKGTCYDTVNEDANEDGPVSGQIASARHTQTPAGGSAPLLLGRTSCNLAPLGL